MPTGTDLETCREKVTDPSPMLRDEGSPPWPGDSKAQLTWPSMGLAKPLRQVATLGH